MTRTNILLIWLVAMVIGPAIGQGATAVPGAARWLSQSTFVASSFETGRIGYLEAWGGDEFGYAYRYSLSGQPNGLRLDSETGMLSLDTRQAAGSYAFTVTVANRRVTSKVAKFPVRLLVRNGTTGNRTGTDILHKTYVVDSGGYGSPRGSDYTGVLFNIRKAIIADQISAGDGRLRATIHFRRGRLYDYTNNGWAVGLQYVIVEPDPRFDPSGPRPRLRNVKRSFTFDSELAILSAGGGSAFELFPDKLKTYSPRIFSVEVGADRVRLKDPRQAANIKVGRWHLVGSYDQQVGGFPPNMRYFDYVRVLSVSGDTIVLDRKLRHPHRDSYFEEPSNPNSMGVARIIPLDPGGPGGLMPSYDARLNIRQTFRNIEFVKNPSTANGSNVVLYISNSLDTSFENCITPRPVPSVVDHMRFVGGTIGSSEPDKLISTLVFDDVKSGEIGGATGVDFYLMRNSTTAPIQVSPRQLRLTQSIIDATTNTHLWYPITWAYNGPVLDATLSSVTLKINPTNTDTRVAPSIQHPSLVIGKDARWSGDYWLVIPRKSYAFLDWQVWLFEGMIIYTDPDFHNWGLVRRLSSPGDGSAIWVNIQWIAGTRPLSGRIHSSRGHSLFIDPLSKLAGNASWGPSSGGFVRQVIPPSFGIRSDFPQGYPKYDYGF